METMATAERVGTYTVNIGRGGNVIPATKQFGGDDKLGNNGSEVDRRTRDYMLNHGSEKDYSKAHPELKRDGMTRGSRRLKIKAELPSTIGAAS